jgi:hypothetical protein
MVKIIPNKFVKIGEDGDFEWMIKQCKYDSTLFIFNDDIESIEKCQSGKGNAVIRSYNQYNINNNIPRSAGIPTGSRKYGGFKILDKTTIKIIDESINKIINLINKYKYNNIIYSADKNNNLTTKLFNVDKKVLYYITERIRELSVLNNC